MKMPEASLWRRLGPLLDELVALPAARRGERLAALRADDAALARAVEPLPHAHLHAEVPRESAGQLEASVGPDAPATREARAALGVHTQAS